MKKNFPCLLMVAVLLCSLCACSGTGGSKASATTEYTKKEAPPPSDAAYHTPAESFAGGSGTAADPFQISTAEELALLGEVNQEYHEVYNTACYVLTADIALNDVSNFSNWGEEEPEYQWKPIGYRFQGSFDGGGFTISGMYVYAVGLSNRNAGLFDRVSQGKLTNVKLTQSYIAADGTGSENAYIGLLSG